MSEQHFARLDEVLQTEIIMAPKDSGLHVLTMKSNGADLFIVELNGEWFSPDRKGPVGLVFIELEYLKNFVAGLQDNINQFEEHEKNESGTDTTENDFSDNG